mgnify:CR=1 FL=1
MIQSCLRISILFLIGSMYSCAIQVAPQGGERDSQPPVLRSAHPAAGSVNFNEAQIIFEFDENISLKDVNTKLKIGRAHV